jgi:hypothetical protein
MSHNRWAHSNKWGGENSEFWTGDVRYLAFNEGGAPPFALNLRLWRGWLPIGFYFAAHLGGRWWRVHPGWR